MYKAGQLIKLGRISKGIGQQELSELLKVNKNYISMVENDKKQPSVAFLKQAAKALDIPLLLLMWDYIDLPAAKNTQEKEIKNRLNDIAEQAQKLFSDRMFKNKK